MRRAPQKAETVIVAGVALSHSDKALYAKDGITKLDLTHYCERIADWLLPGTHAVTRCGWRPS